MSQQIESLRHTKALGIGIAVAGTALFLAGEARVPDRILSSSTAENDTSTPISSLPQGNNRKNESNPPIFSSQVVLEAGVAIAVLGATSALLANSYIKEEENR